jgi:hypothetical protein
VKINLGAKEWNASQFSVEFKRHNMDPEDWTRFLVKLKAEKAKSRNQSLQPKAPNKYVTA